MCTGVFYSKSSLNSHIKAKHEKIRHLCTYCKKRFYISRLLYKTYQDMLCMNAIPMSCEKCGDTFKNVSLLETHKTTHENECSFCQKKAMLQHRAHVHSTLIGKYCYFCKKTFNTKANFMRHLRNIHNSDGPTKGHCSLPRRNKCAHM